MSRRRTFRGPAALAALLCAIASLWFVQDASATAPHGAVCTISGSISGPNPAHVGDPVSASAQVRPVTNCNQAHGIYGITLYGGNQPLCYQPVTNGTGGCSATNFPAYAGLNNVMAVLSDGQSKVVGTFTVLAAPSTAPVSHPRTTLRTQPSTSAPATKSTGRSLAPAPPGPLPGLGAVDSPTDTPTPTTSTTAVDEGGVAVPVAVIHGKGAVSLYPAGLLVATVVVLVGVFGAAVRFVYLNTRGGGSG